MANTDRRRLLQVVLASGAAALCASALAPPIAYVVAKRAGATGEKWVRTVRLEQLHEGRPRKVKIVSDVRDAWKLEKESELGAVWLIRSGDQVRALSVVCPHLGCSVGAAEDGKSFACPCHDSSFTIDGKREGGPSPRDMDTLDARVVDGVVEIDFRRFRQGTPERVEVG
ncbi:MAG TPA: Rieske (2Fe-2S) protein [Polyangiaceae bacterium]|jgi:cytochrome b6-f complex iron-sulfur subunit/menaquinol-cytochrome c reductase iron-sulfur subunit|nr:Rieske (2Fe-2S) protein [Polyangiaceae bacterium]